MSEKRDDEGQVSEVQNLDEPEADEAPEDSVAGYPEGESGDADTPGSGPDAAPPENRRDNEHSGARKHRPGESVSDESLP